MRSISNIISGTNIAGNTSDTAANAPVGSTARAPASTAVAAPVSGTWLVLGSPVLRMRSAGLGRVSGTPRPVASEESISRHPAERPRPVTLDDIAMHQRISAVTQAHQLPVATVIQDLPAGTAVHDLPVATAVLDLPVEATAAHAVPEQYAQPVLRRQSGSLNLLHGLEEALSEAHQNSENLDVVPDLAERPPLRRETGVVRPRDFLNPSDSVPGSRMRPQ